MINVENGEVFLGSNKIGPRTVRNEFVEFGIAKQAVSRQNNEWHYFYVDLVYEVLDKQFAVSFTFKGQRLFTLEFINREPKFNNSYDEWSMEKVYEEKKSNDELLKKMLGAPHGESNSGIVYRYDWGEIGSFLDPKGGNCSILLSYK